MNPKNVKSTMLIHDNNELILFQLTIKLAERGLNVWMITQTPFQKLPCQINWPHKEVLQLMTFMYLKDYKTVINKLNGIHLWYKIPNVILVAGFDKYCDLFEENAYNPLRPAFLCTCLLDSLQSCAIKTSKSFLLIGCANRKEEIFLNRFKVLREMYFQNCISDESFDEETTVQKVLESFEV